MTETFIRCISDESSTTTVRESPPAEEDNRREGESSDRDEQYGRRIREGEGRMED